MTRWRRLTPKQWKSLIFLLGKAAREYPELEGFRLCEATARILQGILTLRLNDLIEKEKVKTI